MEVKVDAEGVEEEAEGTTLTFLGFEGPGTKAVERVRCQLHA